MGLREEKLSEQQSNRMEDRVTEAIGRDNYLPGKVILLMGDDTTVLPNLVTQLAQRGADIALFSWRMPQEIVNQVEDSVNSAGQRFLLIGEAEHQTTSSDGLIQTITDRLGRLDAFIDLTAKMSELSKPQNGNQQLTRQMLANWQLTQAALRAIIRGNSLVVP